MANRRVGVRAGMGRYNANGIAGGGGGDGGGGGGGTPVRCKVTGGSSNSCVSLWPLWKKKFEKSSGFELRKVDACRVEMGAKRWIWCKDEVLETLRKRPGSIIYGPQKGFREI